MKRFAGLLALLFLLANAAFSQRNAFFFPAPPHLEEASAFTYCYLIPKDSIEQIAFRYDAINPRVDWMQHERYRVRRGSEDSAMRSGVTPGYYVCVNAVRAQMSVRILRKPGFTAQFRTLDEVQLLIIRDEKGAADTNVVVMHAGRRVHYDVAMEAFVLRNLANKQLVSISKGSDLERYIINVSRNEEYRKPRAENVAAQAAAARREFNGYLVTNKPKYLPGDTVKWKAYLQLPDEKNTMATEPLTVTFSEYGGYYRGRYYYNNSSGARTFSVSKEFAPEAPGVYFGEFILGDSVTIDKPYELRISGNKSKLSLTQQFKLEDYLLSETKLRVTGETWTLYQKGDSVLLYAAGTDANGLPVLDGTLSIAVTPNGNNNNPDSFYFLPDTLYKGSMTVNPEGENRLAFSTGGFPDELNYLRVAVSMVNSNFERKDTAFNLTYGANKLYTRHTLIGRELRTEVIRNKRSFPTKGFLRRNAYSGDSTLITYPHRLQLNEYDNQLHFYLLDSNGNSTFLSTYQAPRASISGATEFTNDTAYLRVSNPHGLLYRFGIFRADVFIGYGASRRDTTIAVYSPKSETVTINGYYTSQGNEVPARFEIIRLDRNLHIELRKKDIVFPGQTDTISVRLSNDKSEAIPRTNVTVLAYNSQKLFELIS